MTINSIAGKIEIIHAVVGVFFTPWLVFSSRRGWCFLPPTTRTKDYLIKFEKACLYRRVSPIFYSQYKG